ncbi:MAG: AMP-binding protein, partial [Bacteroidetes bacterium]|nr:AMP-binding protein [Bacteroidota bacterium]
MAKTVINMLRNCAETNPGTNYSCEKKGKDWDGMTYADALQESRYISSGLLEIGIKKGDKISTLAEGRNRWITSEFGMLFLGATNVPLALKLIPDEVVFRITHSESIAIITSLVTIKKLAQVYKNLENKIKIIYLE